MEVGLLRSSIFGFRSKFPLSTKGGPIFSKLQKLSI